MSVLAGRAGAAVAADTAARERSVVAMGSRRGGCRCATGGVRPPVPVIDCRIDGTDLLNSLGLKEKEAKILKTHLIRSVKVAKSCNYGRTVTLHEQKESRVKVVSQTVET